MADHPQPDEPITLADAARVAGLSCGTLHTQLRRGRLPAHKVGRQWVLTRGDLHRYLQSRVQTYRQAARVSPDYQTPEGEEPIP